MFKIILGFTLIMTSCASMSEDWGPWKLAGVSIDDRAWRFCSTDLDGAALNRKGMCYISLECRTRKTIFGNEKKECRNAPLFCAWGDIACMDSYNIFNKIIVNKEKTQ